MRQRDALAEELLEIIMRPLRAGQHHAYLEPSRGRLGQTAGGRSRCERHARPPTAPRPRAQVRPAELAHQVGGAGTIGAYGFCGSGQSRYKKTESARSRAEK
jgi:hypothetical protein